MMNLKNNQALANVLSSRGMNRKRSLAEYNRELGLNIVEKAKKGDEYLSFSVGFEHDDLKIVRFYENLTWRRQEKGLKIKVLTNKKIKPIYEKRYSKKVLTTINNRYTSFNFPQGIIIINDKIINLSWNSKATAIIITSKNLAEQYRKFFYEVYNDATQ